MRTSNEDWLAATPGQQLLRRVFAVDVLRCGVCGGRRRLIAPIMRPSAVRGILDALGLPSDAPGVQPARAPPVLFGGQTDSMPVGA